MIQPLQKNERRVIAGVLALWVFLMTLFVPRYAYAYIDPATTTYIIQIAAAIVITLGVSFSIALYRFRMVFTKLWVRVTSRTNSGNGSAAHTKQPEDKSDESICNLSKLDYVISGSNEPPGKPYGFAIRDEESLTRLEQAYSIIEETTDASVGNTSKSRENEIGRTSTYGTTPLKDKLSWLFNDKRSFRWRLAIAVLVSAALVFTVLVFGPLELYASSRGEMLFNLDDFIGALLLVAFVAFFLIVVVLAIMKGRLFDIALCVVAGLALACYVQATFFNGFIGQLTGDAIPWHEHSMSAIINLFVWLACILVFAIIRLTQQKAWQTVTVFVCSLLIAIQLVALVSISGDLVREQNTGGESMVLTSEGTLGVSSQKNIIVFLLDRLDTVYIDRLREKDPNFFYELEGFIEYPDHITRYSHTYPSVPYSFSGVENDYEAPAREYFERAYSEHLFLDDLIARNWNAKLYLCRGYDYDNPKFFSNRASNFVDFSNNLGTNDPASGFITSLRLVKRLDTLSVFRYAPTGFKAVFWMPSSEVSLPIQERHHEYTTHYQLDFMKGLKDVGLSADTESPVFIYYHLEGPHAPFLLDSDGYPVSEGETDSITQAEGCFKIIYEYLSQLKELGVYEDSCIIITGDHGNMGETLTGLFYKPMGSFDEPLIQSDAPVSDRNLVPTIVEQAGIESTALAAEGYSYTEVNATNTPERRKVMLKFSFENGENTNYSLTICDIVGRATTPEDWRVVYEAESDVDYWMNPIRGGK